MGQHDFQLSDKAAEIYETQSVSSMFRSLAEKTIDLSTIDSDDVILDVACGTGIIGRVIHSKFPQIQRLVGTDLNHGMLEVAKKVTSTNSKNFEWYKSDVTDMPFSDKSFTLIFCQQGLQFFPNKSAALLEIFRILKPRGRLVLTVWSEVSPLFQAFANVIKEELGKEVAEEALAPFSFKNLDVISSLIKEAGFTNLECKKLTVNRKVDANATAIRSQLGANPVWGKLENMEAQKRSNIMEQVRVSLFQYSEDGVLFIPQVTHHIIAIA
jgi:ubiquinone/menaquinone biosynthesis C-methylase UbiE